MDEPRLRQQARDKLESGELPREREARVWAGPGAGLPCAVCGDVIGRDDVEYELQIVEPGRSVHVYRFHRRCHAAWQLERTTTRPPSQRPSGE
jgi:hypothetical protein